MIVAAASRRRPWPERPSPVSRQSAHTRPIFNPLSSLAKHPHITVPATTNSVTIVTRFVARDI